MDQAENFKQTMTTQADARHLRLQQASYYRHLRLTVRDERTACCENSHCFHYETAQHDRSSQNLRAARPVSWEGVILASCRTSPLS